MSEEEIDYWLKLFSDNNHTFMSKDGKKITLFKVFDKLKELQQKNQELKKQLHEASIEMQEMIEQDIECPSNCEKLEKLQQENQQLKDNWNKLKEDLINDINYWREQEKEWIKLGFIKFGGEANTKIIFKKVLDKMQELEGSRE